MRNPIITVDEYYSDSTGCMHTKSHKHMFLSEIKAKFDADKVRNWGTVNNISVENGFIFQVGGYDGRRGLYCDLY